MNRIVKNVITAALVMVSVSEAASVTDSRFDFSYFTLTIQCEGLFIFNSLKMRDIINLQRA